MSLNLMMNPNGGVLVQRVVDVESSGDNLLEQKKGGLVSFQCGYE